MTQPFTPIYDRLLVKRLDAEDKVGTLFIPANAKEKPMQGIVIAAGEGRVADDGRVLPLCVKKNDKILFGKYSGTEIELEGVEYLIMREEEVLGIIDKTEAPF
jgi:chaperonin GroES